MERKTWTDRPPALTPNAGETLAQWEARVAAYNAANPGVLTPFDAPATNDLEDRVEEGIEAAVVNEAANVRDPRFAGGAVGDAVNNDQPAFAAAIAAAIAAPKGRVFVPPGTYDWNDPIAVTSDTFVMEGSGARRTIIELDSQNADILTVTPTTTGGESNSGRIKGIKFRTNTGGTAQDNGKAGLALIGMRHFHAEELDFENLDIGFDMRGNCFGSRISKITSSATSVQVGILLRGASPLLSGSTAGSGSDITLVDNWVGGRRGSIWMEGGAGGYHVIAGQVKGGGHSATPQDIYGSILLGRAYQSLASTTADVNPGATTIPVTSATAAEFFSSGPLVIGDNHAVNYGVRDTAGSQLTGVTGVTAFIPSGTLIYIRGGVSAVRLRGVSFEGSSHRHAIRVYMEMDGLTLDACSVNSNGANRIINVIRATDARLSTVKLDQTMVRGTFSGTAPLSILNLSGSWDIQEDQPNVYAPATFNGVSMNFQTKPMTEWSGVNERVRASFGDNVRWMGRTLRWNASVLESNTDSSATTGWTAVTSTAPDADIGKYAALGNFSSATKTDRDAQVPVFTTYAGNPIFDGALMPPGVVYWPCMVSAKTYYESAVDNYYLYWSTDHSTTAGGIFMATAPAPIGPWTYHSQVYVDATSGDQTETPSVIWNSAESLFFMYYHQNGASGGGIRKETQVTMLATSPDGITWTRVGPILKIPTLFNDEVYNGDILHTGYINVHHLGGHWFGFSLQNGTNYAVEILWHSRDGRAWTHDPRPLGNLQHLVGDIGLRVGRAGTQIIRWNGQLWWLTGQGAYVSGAVTAPAGGYVAPLAPNLRQPLGALIPATEAAQPWEGGTNYGIGTVMQDGARLWSVYAGPDSKVGLRYLDAA